MSVRQWVGAVLLGLALAVGPSLSLWPGSSWSLLAVGVLGSILLFMPHRRRKLPISDGATTNDPHASLAAGPLASPSSDCHSDGGTGHAGGDHGT
jgi:hypothetical protein